jgi:hypothetical protein
MVLRHVRGNRRRAGLADVSLLALRIAASKPRSGGTPCLQMATSNPTSELQIAIADVIVNKSRRGSSVVEQLIRKVGLGFHYR